MNTNAAEAVSLAAGVAEAVVSYTSVRVAVCPPNISLNLVNDVLNRAHTHVKLGAQNVHFEDAGAYTGEVSAVMLKSVGCAYVIVGHSERRQYFGETDASVNAKTKKGFAIRADSYRLCWGNA